MNTPRRSRCYRIAKRALDVVLSMLGLVLCAPLMALIALAIRLTSSGPVIYIQQRVGMSGKSIYLFKFRTMYVEEVSESNLLDSVIADQGRSIDLPGRVHKITSDPRITPIGRFLRRTGLDELPNLIRVLKGDLSIVGPRPSLAFEAQKFDARQKLRLAVKPGLVGPWQVSGGSLSWEDMINMDVEYVKSQSLLIDFVILMRAIKTMLVGRGAF